MKLPFALIAATLWLVSAAPAAGADLKLETAGIYNVRDISKNTEILSIQKSSRRLALSCSTNGTVDILSIEKPAAPEFLHRFPITAVRRSARWPSIPWKTSLPLRSSILTRFLPVASRCTMPQRAGC